MEPSIKERRQHFRILLILMYCSLCPQELLVLHVFSVREITANDGEPERVGQGGLQRPNPQVLGKMPM